MHHKKESAFPCMWDGKLLEGAEQVTLFDIFQRSLTFVDEN